MSESKTKYRGLNLGGFVFLIFLALKLAGFGIVATWSWWWIFSPFWLPLAAYVVLMSLFMFIKSLL